MASTAPSRLGFGRRVGHAVEMLAARAVLAAMGSLSLERMGDVGAWIGAHGTAALPFARRRILRNIDLVRPEMDAETRARVVREVGANFARVMVEYDRLHEVAADPSLMDISGAEHVEAAREAGRGAVLVSAHYGNWEFVRLASRQLGAPSAIIYRAFNNPAFDEMAQRVVARAGEPVLHKGRKGSRALLRHVAKGGFAMILIDQRQTGSPLLPFLGRDAETSTAAAELAARFGAALIPARARRLPDGRRFDVRFEAPIPQGDPLEMTRAANDRISTWIDEDPGQWLWLHRRWKLRPRGDQIRAAAEAARG